MSSLYLRLPESLRDSQHLGSDLRLPQSGLLCLESGEKTDVNILTAGHHLITFPGRGWPLLSPLQSLK